MSRILLVTLNARHSHASFGLRCLLANLGPLRKDAELREFIIGQPTLHIVEQLLAAEPEVLGFGVYIWNVAETTAVMELIRVLRPQIRLVIGGPEVSYEYEDTAIFRLADHLITGEGDVAFRELVAEIFEGRSPPKVIRAAPPDVSTLQLPYDEYTDADLRERLLYVEASRGCPFQCEFCLSSLDERVRAFPLQPFLDALGRLLARGARCFKFVDRTFNLSLRTSVAILEFCLLHHRPGFELHFEMIPDRLPQELRVLLARFPAGAVQLELGIQTFTPGVLRDISRTQNVERLTSNLRFLREETGVHVHSDLIFGLPGETTESFADSFNQLLALGPEEIQLGFLKRLRGTPIIRHTASADLRFSPRPPYEILQTATISFAQMQQMKRFARYFDLYYNSGNFLLGMEVLLAKGPTPFAAFARFAEWLFQTTRQTHEFALSRLYKLLFTYLTSEQAEAPQPLAEKLLLDFDRHQVRRERLDFLRPYVDSVAPPLAPRAARSAHGAKRRGQGMTMTATDTPELATPAPAPPLPPAPETLRSRRLPVLQ